MNGAGLWKFALVSESEQSANCRIDIESFLKKIDDRPVGEISHSKQKLTVYPLVFVSTAVIPNGEAPSTTFDCEGRSDAQPSDLSLHVVRGQSFWLMWVKMVVYPLEMVFEDPPDLKTNGYGV